MSDKLRTEAIMCKVLLTLDDLKRKGLVEGGPGIDRAGMTKIVAGWEDSNGPIPCDGEFDSVLSYLMAEASEGRL